MIVLFANVCLECLWWFSVPCHQMLGSPDRSVVSNSSSSASQPADVSCRRHHLPLCFPQPSAASNDVGVLGRNREVIQELVRMPNRGSSDTFTGQGFPTS